MTRLWIGKSKGESGEVEGADSQVNAAKAAARTFGRLEAFRALRLGLLVVLGSVSICVGEGATRSAMTTFDAYVGEVEARVERQHQSRAGFVAGLGPGAEARLRRGELVVEKLTPSDTGVSGALLHHWRGTAFVPGAKAADFERLMKEFDAYPQNYRPQVVRSRVLMHEGERFRTVMRVRQQHVITVVMDTTYDVTFGKLDPQFGYSYSRSTQVSEISSPGTASEHALRPEEEHGFLWRLNSYWSYAERDGGLYMQIESVSLTRDIPHGLGWVVRPFVQSIPRESLEFTLRATGDALRKRL